MSQKRLHDLIFGSQTENDQNADFKTKKINSTKKPTSFRDLLKQSQQVPDRQMVSQSQFTPVQHVVSQSQFTPARNFLSSEEPEFTDLGKRQNKGNFNNYKQFKDVFSQRFHESQISNPFGEFIEPGWADFCRDKDLTGEAFLAFFHNNQYSDIRRIDRGEFKNSKLNRFFGRIKSLEVQNNELVFVELDNPTGKIDCFFDKGCFNYALKNICFSQSQSQRNQSTPFNKNSFRNEIKTVTIGTTSNENLDKPPFSLGVILELHEPSVVSLDQQNYFLLVKPNNIAKFHVNPE